ncbi:MAG: hypothetical protein ACLFN8_05320 [Candidatus Woesearchaeota archaeon]
MSDKKEKKLKPHEEHFETYKKHVDANEVFIKELEASNAKSIGSLLGDSKYDFKKIKEGGKIIHDLTDDLLNTIIKSASPAFKKMYNIDLPKLSESPASKNFYEAFMKINKKQMYEFLEENKKDLGANKILELTNSYLSKWKQDLDQYADDHIDTKTHLEDYLDQYKLKGAFKKELLPSLKESVEARPLLRSILDYAREDTPDVSFVKNIAQTYEKQTKGQININKYLA